MRQIFTVIVLCAAALLSAPASAAQIQINVRTPFVYIQIGHGLLSNRGLLGPPANLVDEVSFTFPAGVQPADGTPIVGTPVIPMAVIGMNTGRLVNFRVTMDSSIPLRNATGDPLPFSAFSWTARDGDIPDGQFDDSPNQVLMDYFRRRANKGRGVVDALTFTFANDTLYTSGTYTGRVVYTITEL
jgi:hypothetical protein